MKQCTKCKRFLPETEFNFVNKKINKRRNDCRDCRNAKRRKIYWTDEEYREKVRKQDTKSYHKNIEKKRAYDKKRGKTLKRKLWCKQYNKKYHEEHKEERKKKDRVYYLNNKERKLELQRKYYWANKEKRNEYGRKHKHENRAYYNEIERRREIKKQGLHEDFTPDEWKQKVEQTNGRCPICNRLYSEVYPFVVTLDHSPPISKAPKGYHYILDDISPMCGSCNSSKADKVQIF